MADTESILQLGIDAARAGQKEEARDLFRLLTREKPDDPQAWLWLAGVSDDRAEKQGALEQALRLDPYNELARKSMEALGLAPVAAKAPPPPAAPADDFGFAADPFAVPSQSSSPSRTPEPEPDPFAFVETPKIEEPQTDPHKTRQLTAEEEWAMSLDSLGSMSTAYNDQAAKSGSSDASDFNIPDFGFGEEDVDVSAYMNRQRVDPSQIEVTAEEAKKPVRKPIVSGLPGKSERKQREKDNAARSTGARGKSGSRQTSSGYLPMVLGLIGAVLVFGLLWWLINNFFGEETAVTDGTPTVPALAQLTPGTYPTGGPIITGTNPLITPTVDFTLPTPDPNAPTPDPNVPTVPPVEPTPVFNQPVDPNLGSVQPALLPNDGFNTVTVARENESPWFFTFGGATQIGDGNAMGIQPQGRWVEVTVLMFDGDASGRQIPTDLMVLKDAQGRVYQPNPQASAAFRNTYFVGDIDMTQPAPNFNFLVPLVFDVAPDATDLVLFSPLDTGRGFYVRANPN